MRRVHGGGFIEGTIQWLGGSPAIHPYMSAYTTMASLRRGDHAQVVEDFYWYLLHSTAAHAFPEGIFPEPDSPGAARSRTSPARRTMRDAPPHAD